MPPNGEKRLRFKVSGQKNRVPADATIEFEYERDGEAHELEVEIKWKSK